MKKHSLTGLLVLIVFAVFMVSVLQILVSGADILQNLTHRDQRTYHHRTASQYITTRIRHADKTGSVTADNSGEQSALILSEEIDGQVYQTRIYCYDGYLREMLFDPGIFISPEFGEEILPMEDFQVSLEDSCIRAELSLPNGSNEQVFLFLRSEGGPLS